jgi:peptidoglycan hydrolase CwlO-like protein
MDKITKRIEALQEKIADGKEKQANLQGRMEEAESRLKEVYGLSLDSAKTWLKQEEERIKTVEEDIRKKFKALEELYPW